MSASWIEQWRGLSIFVLGDVMVDRFVYGRVDRVSPEAPIPVLHYQSAKMMLGGAGNVARNIVSLGGRAILAGVVGGDAEGDLAAGELAAMDGVESRLVRVNDHPTTIKTRFVSGSHQVMRLDVEAKFRMDLATSDAIFQHYLDCAPQLSVVVLSDYAKGVLDPTLIARVVDDARDKGLCIVVDPKTRDVHRYRGATVLTPNAAEAAMISGIDGHDDASAEAAAREVQRLSDVSAVVLTRGAQGMTIYDSGADEGIAHIPTVATDVFDVSGAGDTVVAALSLALGSGASVATAARIANAAAGVAVGKRGTSTVHARELSVALGGVRNLGDPKIVTNDAAREVVADWKDHGLKVGFTNGCFDLLHPGHVELLKRARASCDRLVVALNSDASVKRLKGDSRPVQNEHARALVMAAIQSADLVTLFEDDTPLRLIDLLRPDYLIKGADYTEATVVGADLVKSWGGRVILAPLEPGHSTTSMIARANNGSGR
jgi:D-beta-D-heptose 7-phosphate kinase/D-beta-D-heptose 1-phosphate adenosyltransferase